MLAWIILTPILLLFMGRGNVSNYIEIKNTRTVVINDSYKNVSFWQKIDIASCIKTYDTGVDLKGILPYRPYIKIPLEEGNIFAIHSDDPTIPFMFNCHNGGPEILSNLWIPKRGWTRDQEYTLPYTKAFFYIFCYQTASGNQGLEVFNSKGEQIFNSNMKYLRIIDVINEPVDTAYWGVRSYAHKIGLVCCSIPVEYDNYGDRSASSDRLVVYFPSYTSFAVGTFSYENGITGLQSKPNGDFRGNFYFLVVDLDGLD